VTKRWIGRLAVCCVLGLVGYFAWAHRYHVANALASRSAPIAEQPPATYAEVREAQQVVGVSGPLADYMLGKKPVSAETSQAAQTQAPTATPSPVSTVMSVPDQAAASGPVAESPVGTSSAILHRTFRVAGTMNLPFEVPARAANPQPRGSYQSSAKQGADVDVGFLVLNEKQYGDFLAGHGGEAIFSAEDAQEVNVSLPPTFERPAKYYLVFRDNSPASGKKVVRADFRIDF